MSGRGEEISEWPITDTEEHCPDDIFLPRAVQYMAFPRFDIPLQPPSAKVICLLFLLGVSSDGKC